MKEERAVKALEAAKASENQLVISAASQQVQAIEVAIQQLDRQQEEVQALAGYYADVAREQDVFLQRQEVLRGVFDGIGRAAGAMFEEMVTGFERTGSAMEALRNFGRQVINELISGLTRLLIIQPLTQAIAGSIGGLNIPGIGTKQRGGYATGLNLVGEEGPEFVDFNRPGQVYSNRQLRDALRGGVDRAAAATSFVFNFAINSTDGPGVRAALQEAVPEFERRTAQAIALNRRDLLEGAQRPGRVRRILKGY